ncbi:MAG: sulfatase-like hydrolase/transferase [Acidobacteria bacterium]|uniref:Sulfatase-like hydrolase/transferase n=1 Tax=Candidatus Polarisedimenticola svalbardensis TaxID=2886004 RepID=A0A8J6XS69_9BACT|nr:sulfatase-like hydrolase/transferase [Candidatus Polarisedimenticola svalbardensis]
MAQRLQVIGLLLVGLAMFGCGATVPPEERSVILITVDTTRADRLGLYGGTAVPTPNLDRLGSLGVVVEEGISQVPLTLPAHSSIMTGKYPASHGVHHNGIFRLPEGTGTLAARLRDEGLATGAFVSAYVLNRGFGVEQGFDTFSDVPVNRFEGGRDQLFSAERTAAETNEKVFPWLEENSDRRFFLWVHYYDPHEPYAPPEDRELEGEGYDREISYLDSEIGALLNKLEDLDLLERSVLVLTGDHGESLGEHGELTHGIFLYESAVHVPMFFLAPGLLPEGTRLKGTVELVDIQPTVLDLLGLQPLPGTEGVSQVERLEGNEDIAAGPAHAETLMGRLEFGWAELHMVRDGRYKYIEAPTPELYDLREDPSESVNLATNDPERVGEMAELLGEWKSITEAAADPDQATRSLTSEEEEALRSLGYLSGGSYKEEGADQLLPDPKDMIQELRRLGNAKALALGGDHDGALLVFEELLRAHPRNHQARLSRITSLINLKRHADAEEEARAGLVLASQEGDAAGSQEEDLLGFLATLAFLQNRNGEAEEIYRDLIARDPENDLAGVDYARLLIETGREEEALKRLNAILARTPGNGMALAARFQAERILGMQEEMLRTAEELADAQAGDLMTLELAGDLLIGSGDPARAAVCYEIAQEQLPDLSPRLLMKLGQAQAAAGDLDSAEQTFLACNKLMPRDPRPPFYLGLIDQQRDDPEKAGRRFREALNRNPRFAPAREALARIGATP